MRDLTDEEIDAALERSRSIREREPRARTARYDAAQERVEVELTNGCLFAFPVRLAQGLERAGADELTAVRILGAGSGLHWETLDVDLSVPELMMGVFGAASFMARRAGRTTTSRKAAAARLNGAKGGRPRKTAGA